MSLVKLKVRARRLLDELLAPNSACHAPSALAHGVTPAEIFDAAEQSGPSSHNV